MFAVPDLEFIAYDVEHGIFVQKCRNCGHHIRPNKIGKLSCFCDDVKTVRLTTKTVHLGTATYRRLRIDGWRTVDYLDDDRVVMMYDGD